jgi:hypothetical protein
LPELQHNLNLLMDMCEQVHTKCMAENQTLYSMKNNVFWDVEPTGLGPSAAGRIRQIVKTHSPHWVSNSQPSGS